jgi:hypothetical protein
VSFDARLPAAESGFPTQTSQKFTQQKQHVYDCGHDHLFLLSQLNSLDNETRKD